ncbi:2-succinyl-5-enolpyruvyl-6-hydroxy-3-cyclohexene-1-carboxylic-acid synthase [Celerinatantimonas yamalensis]|uniref:2-succinyl-5-enolpyruvyl-6-hydroxy-3-cyclohexene-1-carboxylate synthase n=1 Tax=Celerinatantimonas yamalensis TaxID=559956 RepID=A0ABW9GA73_9GAMM
MITTNCDNLNLLWAQLLIEECTRLGISDACIAPGSRSAPLTMAAAAHPKLQCHTHFDERGLGFLALGLTKASQRPVLVICTSGSALANLYPAVVEAAQTAQPLVLACADRPLELVNCGANQAIQQPRIFANFPVAELDLPAPDSHFPPRALLGKLDDLIASAQSAPGPVFINCPYREPFYPSGEPIDFSDYLAPLASWLGAVTPLCRIHPVTQYCSPSPYWPPAPTHAVLIVLGALTKVQMQAIVDWAKSTGWPIFADIQSQAFGLAEVITTADSLLQRDELATLSFDYILQFSGRLVSKTLQQWLDTQPAEHWLIAPGTTRFDPYYQLSQHYPCDIFSWLENHPAPTYRRDDAKRWLRAQQRLLAPKGNDELSMVASLASQIPEKSALMLGNSLAIRHMQMVGQTLPASVNCFANRGCSGIDGLLATACGIALNQPVTTLILGDTSLLHDLNSLALTRQLSTTLIIVVINNDGGSIFELLPIPRHGDLAQTYYQLPHGMNFAAVAAQFAINYQQVTDDKSLIIAYQRALQQGGAQLLELTSKPTAASRAIRQLGEQVRALSSL